MTEYVQIVTTVASHDDAQRIARALVEERLAACVQVAGPIESVYHWQGTVETSQEWLAVAKTSRAMFDDVAARIRELHTYDVPEILAVPVIAGDLSYLNWLHAELKPR